MAFNQDDPRDLEYKSSLAKFNRRRQQILLHLLAVTKKLEALLREIAHIRRKMTPHL
jgi:hypothetical protein